MLKWLSGIFVAALVGLGALYVPPTVSMAQQSYPLVPFQCPAGQFTYAFNPVTGGLPGWFCATPGVAKQIVTPPATNVGDIAVWGNNNGSQLNDTGLIIQTTVATNAALKALVNQTPGAIAYRASFSALNDGGEANYELVAGNCTISGGDNGFEVQPTGMVGCWILIVPVNGVSLAVWGNITGTDDSALFAAADAAMGNSAWTGPKILLLPAGNIAPSNSAGSACTSLMNVQTIIGAGDQPGGTDLVGLSASCVNVLQYVGAGPISFQNFAMTCATYAVAGTFTSPNCPNTMLNVEPASATQQVSHVYAKGLRFVGGANRQMQVAQGSDINIDVDQSIASYGFGVVVTDATITGPTTQVSHVRIKIRDCRVPGQYCLSMPVNATSGVVMYTPRDIDVDVHCNGAGYLGNKACADLTGSTVDQLRANIFSLNGFTGTEIKHTSFFDNSASPGEYTNINANIIEHKQIDSGNCAEFPYETSATALAPDQYRHLVANITCTFDQPPARLSGAQVFAGDVYTFGGNTYLVVSDGVLSSGTPTLGTTTLTGYTDGTAIVEFAKATPTQATSLVGFFMEAVSDFDIILHGYGIAVGGSLTPEGSSDNTIRNGTIKIVGQFNKACLQDNLNTEFGAVNGTIDNVTFDDWDAHITSGNITAQDCLVLGATNGTQTNTWTNLRIDGGTYNGRFSLATKPNGGAITGMAVGANFNAYNAAFSIASPNFNFTVAGGRLANTGGAGATSGLIDGGTGATGTVILSHVTGHNSNSANQGSVINSGSLVVQGQVFNDVASSTTPTAHCTAGVDFEPGTIPANAYLWGCSAANTWGKAY